MTSHDSTVDTLRKAMRTRRRELSETEQNIASHRLGDLAIDHLSSEQVLRRPGRLGTYLAANGEISTEPITRHLTDLGWSVWAPVVGPGHEMSFASVGATTVTAPNRYGIDEPVDRTGSHDASDLDVIIVPCVAIDLHGNRLGMGAGYYDRALTPVMEIGGRPPHGPLLIGIGYDFQIVDRLRADPWDVPMDVVITDRRVIVPSRPDVDEPAADEPPVEG